MDVIVLKRGSRTALALKVSNSKYGFIEMHDERLFLAWRTWGEIEGIGYIQIDYSPSRAAAIFLQHGAGVTPEARDFLQHFVDQEEHQEMTIEAKLDRTNELLEAVLQQLKPAPATKAAAKPVKEKEKPTVTEAEPASAADTFDDTEEVVTVDVLRALFGTLTEAGKKEEAIKVFTSRGINGVGKTPPEKFAEVAKALRAL